MCHELKPDRNVLRLLEPAAVCGSEAVSLTHSHTPRRFLIQLFDVLITSAGGRGK